VSATRQMHFQGGGTICLGDLDHANFIAGVAFHILNNNKTAKEKYSYDPLKN